jgi:NaMN:DMB phosphoribosyltransferase
MSFEAFLARGERTLAEARRVAADLAAGKPIPADTSTAVALLAQLELQQPRRTACNSTL